LINPNYSGVNPHCVEVCACGKVCRQAPAPPGWRCAGCAIGVPALGRPVAEWAADFGWVIVGPAYPPARYTQGALFGEGA
jgi:hypothetical protein